MKNMTLKSVIRCIDKKAAASSSPLIISIGGGSGSGKAELALRIRKYFRNKATVLSADRYYRTTAGINTDTPDSFDIPLLLSHMTALREGSYIEAPTYDYRTCTRQPQTTRIEPVPIIIVEGFFMLLEEFATASDMRIFIQTGKQTRSMRKLKRDTARTGKNAMEIIEYFETTVHPMHELYIEPTKRNADIIISNEYNL